MGTKVRIRRISAVGLAIAVVGSAGASGALRGSRPNVWTSPPGASTARAFYEQGRAIRDAAIRQALGCDTTPDDPGCRAIRPRGDGVDLAPATDHVVVGFAPRKSASAEAAAHSSRVEARIGRSVLLDVPAGSDVESFIAELRRDPDVVFAEPDHRVRALGERTQDVDWGVRALKSQAAQTTNNVTGDGVVVAVVDTGVDYQHVDLDDNIAINTAEDDGDGVFDPNGAGDNDGVDDDGNGFVDDVAGFDFIGNLFTAAQPDNDPNDIVGHGTHVAGIVAAEDNTTGVRGMAPSASILPVRVLDDGGGGFDSTVAQGIYYAVDRGADIINMSLGTYGASTIVRQAVEHAHAQGVAVVAAAGNEFFYSLGLFPASFPGVVSVAAAPDADPTSDTEPLTKVWFSNWGSSDFLAPGVDVLSTTPNDTYERFSGTSMASPHVAGALALVHERFTDAGLAPTPEKIQQALAASATDVYFSGADEVAGAGVPNALAATTISAATHQVTLDRDRFLIPSNGDATAPLELTLLEGDGDPIAGEGVTWSTDIGTIVDAQTVTDAAGHATAGLIVDDAFGIATVTAHPAAHPPVTTRIIVEDDRIRVDDAYIVPTTEVVEEEPPPPDEFAPSNGDEPPIEPEGPGLDAAIPRPGADVTFRVYLGQHDFAFNDDRVSSVSWTVTDPNGATVADLSGVLDPVVLFGFGSQLSFASEPMIVPFDALEGTYHLSVTATMASSGETHTFEKDFPIGFQTGAEILVVNSSLSFDVETFNYLWDHQTDSAVRRVVEATGRTFTFWDPDVHGGQPSFDVLRAHPVVIVLGGELGEDIDLDALSDYVGLGGNLIVSGEHFAGVARASSSGRFRDLLRVSGLLSSSFPDDNNQHNPASVTFADTDFDPLDALTASFALGPYDLEHPNESTALFTDEIKVLASDDTEALATYPSGKHAPNGFESAGVFDDGFARAATFGFGIESIADATPQASLDALVDAFVEFFEPAPEISGVNRTSIKNRGRKPFYIEGDNFQAAGNSTVRLDGSDVGLTWTVIDRHTIEVFVEKGFLPGTYDITVENPDGQSASLSDAITVVQRKKK